MLKITKGQRILASAILVIASFILYKTIGYEIITIVVMIISTLLAGMPIFLKAFSSLKYRIVGIEALVTIAVTGAVIIGEYWEAAAVTFLFMLGDYLEARTIDKTRSSIKGLLALAPDITRVIRNNVEVEIDPDEVIKGDIVLVKPGEKISIDGVIIEGFASINQATITGESIPINKTIGDEVFSGTIVESGYLKIEAIRVGEDTTFARILEMVEEAQDKKAKTQKFIERFSKYYTPAIIVLAIVLYLLEKDINLSLTLLVIACPGALVISTPVSIVAGIGNGAKRGILFKGGEMIEKLGKAKVIAFDKTGTLTIGKPVVKDIVAYGISEEELLKIAAIGESYSEHPLAKAIINKAKEQNIDINHEIENVMIITGQGIKFNYLKKSYLIGNRKLLIDNQISIYAYEVYLQEQEENGNTVVIVSDDEKVIGIISIADMIRSDAKLLIKSLRKQGIQKLVMLTGDNNRTAKAIANEIGLDEYYGELLPEGKVAIINDLKAKYQDVIMVGDGVNDAPALATADLGIAIGGAGKDVAMETADIVLMSERLEQLKYAIGLSRATRRNMMQNIYFALIVAGFLLAGVLIKTVDLSLGMLIHEISVLLVIINAVRLLKYGKIKKRSANEVI